VFCKLGVIFVSECVWGILVVCVLYGVVIFVVVDLGKERGGGAQKITRITSRPREHDTLRSNSKRRC
jgi:hypothetical protein